MQNNDPPKLPLTDLWGVLETPRIEDYLKNGGYGTAVETARRGGREVIRMLREARLRTLDGAGNPVYRLWLACQSAPADFKYVVCVTDEPDPKSPVYREILLRSPHLVLEGMICGALAAGATQAFLYVREDDHTLLAVLEQAVREAHAYGFLGEDALLELEILTGDHFFFCWRTANQVAYIESLLERKVSVERGVSDGLFGWPTIMHEPETWAQIPLVLQWGPEWYCSLGRGLSGTKLVNLQGPLNRPGLVEVPLGMPVKEILERFGEGIREEGRLKAVQFGGHLGGFLPEELLDVPLDFEALAEAGVSMGSGGMEVIDDTVCMVAHTLELAYRCLGDACGQRAECSQLLTRIKRLLGEIEEGRGTQSHMVSLQRTGMQLLNRNSQGSEGSVARPLLTALSYFRYDFVHHIDQKVCATGKRSGLETAPCQAACPAGVDVASYVALIAHGRYREAVEVIRKDNPLAWVCGIICTHPCERVCTRGEMDEPISIMALKGFAVSRVMAEGGYPQPSREAEREEKVAVVGSGPAGLAAAYFLALKGYRVTIFEALPVAGGVLSVGIPEYRLPIAVVQQEIEAVLSLGVELRTGVRVGRDISLDELRKEGFKAFFLGLGAHKGLHLEIEGEKEFHPVMDVMGFLREVRMGRKAPLADKVVVVGGGNAAIDAARTCVRLGSSEVTIAYRRTRKEMPAWEEEIVQAEEEGVDIRYLTIPKRVLGEAGRVTGLECLKAELGEPDASGRQRPVPVTGSEHVIPAGAVIVAIGQRPDLAAFDEGEELSVDTRSRLVVDDQTLQTNVPDVFAGGDVVTGPATVVQAVGAGKWAAESIHAFIQGKPLPMGPPAATPHLRIDPLEMQASEKLGAQRAQMPLLPMELRRHTFKKVELGFSEEDARREAARCLRCDLCVGCGLCQAVCEEIGARALHLSATAEGRLALTDFHHPARSCIGCGSCVQVCPHRNIRMHDAGGERRIVFCGTQTAKLTLEVCEECGETLAPQAYLAYLRKTVESDTGEILARKLCPACSRKLWAEGQMGDVLWFPPSEH